MRDERYPFRYRSSGVIYVVMLSPETTGQIWSFIHSPVFIADRTSRAAFPKEWNSNTWFVLSGRKPLPVYTDVDDTVPPPQIMRWFKEAEAMPPLDNPRPFSSKDICLGFCYDPLRSWPVHPQAIQ